MTRRPRLGFVGPALGRNPGRVISQGEILADQFAHAGYVVRETSSALRSASRAAGITRDLLRWGRSVDVLVVAVYSGRSFLYAELALVLATVISRPVVLVLHGGNLPAFRERHPRRVGRVLARADHIVAPSPYLAGWTRDLGRPVTEIPNVVPDGLDAYRARRSAAPTLLWMRTFAREYDPELALDVLAVLADRYDAARLTMAGQDGDLRATAERRCRQLGLGERVRFVGYLDPAGKEREFGRHDVFLHTSLIDNAPVSVLEAMAHGLVVVATAVGGVPALVSDGEEGVLAPAGDAAGLASAVARVVDDPALAERLSVAGAAVARRSTWAAVRPRWEAVLSEVADRGRGGPTVTRDTGRADRGVSGRQRP